MSEGTGILKKLGIVKSRNKSSKLFESEICPDFGTPGFMNTYIKPSDYVNQCWEKYNNLPEETRTNAMNGAIFELIISTLMVKEKLYPFYLQAEVAFVPNVHFDIMLYRYDDIPIGISLKTSLRERYKQADLEATALKFVHRKAKNYLITMDESEAATVSGKIEKTDILGLDKVMLANGSEFDDLIEELKGISYILPEPKKVIETDQIVTKDKVEKVMNK